jgi:hypothetical protein
MSSLKRWQNRLRRWRSPLGKLDPDQWLSQARRQASAVVAVVNPEWRGIYCSTIHLFPTCLPVADGLTRRSARRIADLLLSTGARRIVFSGFPESYQHLVAALAHASRARLYALWHGNFMQSAANHEWQSFCAIKRLASEGRLHKIGFVKSGMADAFQRIGIPAAFVINSIDILPASPSTPDPGGPHLGIAAVNLNLWRKLPFAMLAAAGEAPGAVVHVAGANDRVREFVNQMRVTARISRSAIPQAEMPNWLRTKHLNLYVTLSECCPMLPLESLAVGVPCLIGPCSHLFEDDDYLRGRLVVPYPERHEVIARYIRQALAERDQIVSAYARWLPEYVARSRQSVADFIDVPLEAIQYPPRLLASDNPAAPTRSAA